MTLSVYAHFFGGFFSVIPLVSLLVIYKCIVRAMWASASDTD